MSCKLLFLVLLHDNRIHSSILLFRYRKLAILHHPDKNGTEGNARFQEIAEAYSILSDVNTKEAYDKVRFDFELSDSDNNVSF